LIAHIRAHAQHLKQITIDFQTKFFIFYIVFLHIADGWRFGTQFLILYLF